MSKRMLILILLLCPPAAFAEEWHYGDEAGGGDAAEPAEPAAGSARPVTGELPASAPANNTPMSKVRESLGEPEKILEAVGEPPIARWQYPGFVVYFERDRVITSVAGRI